MRKLVLPVTVMVLWAFTGVASASAQVLMGDQNLANYSDSNGAGFAQAFQYTASASGNVSDIELYVNSGSTATTVLVGLYSDASGRPGSLLASGSLQSPQSKAWNDIKLASNATLAQGTNYWIAVLGTNGKLNYLDTARGSAPSYVDSTKHLTSLPQTYSPGTKYNMSPASAYVNGSPDTQAVLLGDQSMGPTADRNTAGLAQAFTYQATASGTTTDIDLYMSSGTTASELMLGVYSNANGKPGNLLTSGAIASPKAQAWNDVKVGSVTVTAGNTYWLAFLGTGGEIAYPDTMGGSSASYVESASGLTGLPATYSSGTEYNASPATAYVVGLAGSAPPATAPANTTAPAVTGQAVQGQTLSTSSGSWSGSPTSYAYQWQHCSSTCSNILGATSSSYTVQSADVGDRIDVIVTATNDGGSASASSAATATVTAPTPAAPANTIVPAVAGQAVQGQALSTSNGSWSNSPTSYAYQWQDCNSSGGSCVNIAGATSSSYTLGAGDVGSTVRSVVTATNAGGSASASSAATTTVTAAAAPVNTAVPAISGTAQVGATLSSSTGSWSDSPTSYGYQWEDCNSSGGSCSPISGASASTYTLGSGDVGDTVRSVVTACDASGCASAASGATGVVNSAASVGYYVGQSSAGSGNGSSCANEEPATWLNNSANWGAGKAIAPGTVVGLCGTITSPLAAQGSGTSGNPITVYWEPNATLSEPVCSGSQSSCFNTNGHTYLTLNGGTTGRFRPPRTAPNLRTSRVATGYMPWAAPAARLRI